ASVRQSVALALRTRGEQELAHGCGQAHAVGGDVAGRVLHGVKDGHTRSDGATRRVDVQGDVLLRVLRGQQQDLSAELVRDFVVDLATQEDDALAQQTLEDRVVEIHPSRVGGHEAARKTAHCAPFRSLVYSLWLPQ